MKPFIKLESLSWKAPVLEFSFTTSLNIFRKNSFYIKYDCPISDPNESINAIPFAALMMPICWATGADLILPSLDAVFSESLERCSGYWRKCYPRWSFAHRLMTRRVKNEVSGGSKSGMLFSGGIDSLCTYLRHREESPELFVVMGADIPESKTDFIRVCKERIFNDLARSQGIKLNYIHTDMKEVIDKKKIRRFSSNWYGAVQFSLMLTSLTAPLSYRRLKKLIIAGCSHGVNYQCPCAGDPEVVQNIRWGGTEVQDDSNEISRFEKVAHFLKGSPELFKYLRVCWVQFDEINCGQCEKCYRTLCELLANNIDPNQANFHFDQGSLLLLKSKLLHSYHLFFRGNEAVLTYWRDIQRNMDLAKIKDIHGSREFFEWFSRFDRIRQHTPRWLTRAGTVYEKITCLGELARYFKKGKTPHQCPDATASAWPVESLAGTKALLPGALAELPSEGEHP